jgi:two-component system response regulator YesN
MEDRCEENIKLEEICSAFGSSKSFLSRFFKSRTGESLHSFAEKTRIKRAKDLLREENLNITEISSKLSYENSQYFARAFKRNTGMTPGEWRNSAKRRSGD